MTETVAVPVRELQESLRVLEIRLAELERIIERKCLQTAPSDRSESTKTG